jgi:hypothetical protein
MKRRTSMKSKFTFALATSMLVMALAANPPKANAAVEIYLRLDGIPGVIPAGAVSYVVSLVSSLVLP